MHGWFTFGSVAGQFLASGVGAQDGASGDASIAASGGDGEGLLAGAAAVGVAGAVVRGALCTGADELQATITIAKTHLIPRGYIAILWAGARPCETRRP